MNGNSKLRGWLIVALVISVAINAFLLGAVATDLLRGPRHGLRQLSYELRWLQSRLSPDAFRQVQSAVAANQPAFEAHLATLQTLRQDLGKLAAAPQPDRAAIDAQLAAIRGELVKMVGESQKVTMDAVLALPPTTRADLAQAETGD